jgi:hypothetical protein
MQWLDLLFDLPSVLIKLMSHLRWHRLDFMMQQQHEPYWCWAAVATSVSLYYDPASTWTQCSVVNRQLGRRDCCRHGNGSACNIPGSGTQALTLVGRLRQHLFTAATFNQVTAEIDAGQPLGIRIVWSGGSAAHILAIAGYYTRHNMIALEDPLYGSSDADYDVFPASYQSGAVWAESYLTQA